MRGAACELRRKRASVPGLVCEQRREPGDPSQLLELMQRQALKAP